MTDEQAREALRVLIATWGMADVAARRLIVAVERRRREGPPDSLGSDSAGWQRCLDALTTSTEWVGFTAALAIFEEACKTTDAATAQLPHRAGRPIAEKPEKP